ncbi:hypothetical protein COCSUDRAFT_60340 [Coccomyxa subellipsoidea C-169]|uniref:Uncharacterized protein n=1 Tax=Coccomyxa subellipsoidea (strain C-169) TaxID=574566 RepID=I0YJ06_COCSC|nr:hypothetical protein COCSUDRAFT_60340 [Coccomyxa subellipsoidea C-169]EIE18375.1 hypothetical protein COCSUDRAFT_60340 [Coccomyxa subellipsoidea C-169]|eukprot:XP_005642919.1 hypothetical protein COCSUDRAFT_60340 [Coccomyxa subellipsoidea C-169]
MTPAPVALVTDKGIVALRRGLDALAAHLPAADQVPTLEEVKAELKANEPPKNGREAIGGAGAPQLAGRATPGGSPVPAHRKLQQGGTTLHPPLNARLLPGLRVGPRRAESPLRRSSACSGRAAAGA